MNCIAAYTSHTDSVPSLLSGLKPKTGVFLSKFIIVKRVISRTYFNVVNVYVTMLLVNTYTWTFIYPKNCRFPSVF